MVMYSTANILVVDDDKSIRDIVCLMLSTMGCVAIPAQDATEALDRMKNIYSFNLVLTDINMPQMDGWELAFHIKELYPDMPILALTGEAPETILPKLSGSGIDDALFKPFNLAYLRDAMSRLLQPEGMKYAS